MISNCMDTLICMVDTAASGEKAKWEKRIKDTQELLDDPRTTLAGNEICKREYAPNVSAQCKRNN